MSAIQERLLFTLPSHLLLQLEGQFGCRERFKCKFLHVHNLERAGPMKHKLGRASTREEAPDPSKNAPEVNRVGEVSGFDGILLETGRAPGVLWNSRQRYEKRLG